MSAISVQLIIVTTMQLAKIPMVHFHANALPVSAVMELSAMLLMVSMKSELVSVSFQSPFSKEILRLTCILIVRCQSQHSLFNALQVDFRFHFNSVHQCVLYFMMQSSIRVRSGQFKIEEFPNSHGRIKPC